MKSQQVIDILNQIDPGQPVGKLKLLGRSIAFKITEPQINLPDDKFVNHLINANFTRNIVSYGTKEYRGIFIDTSSTLSKIKTQIIDDFLNLVINIMPNKEPRRTSLFKACKIIRKKAKREDFDGDLFDKVFGLSDYYYSVTRDVPISSPQNEVHRKNLLYILKSLEQKYGKTDGIR
jgi:hypothetical protein